MDSLGQCSMEWSCQHCTFLNKDQDTRCEMCQNPRHHKHQQQAKSSDESSAILSSRFETERADYRRKDRHNPNTPSRGIIQQENALDQFHPKFKAMIDKYHFPRAACGAFAAAYAVILSKFLPKKSCVMDGADVEMILKLTRTVDKVQSEVLSSSPSPSSAAAAASSSASLSSSSPSLSSSSSSDQTLFTTTNRQTDTALQ